MYRTKVGIDLAKKVIQVCIYRDKKVLSNVEMTAEELLCWLINAKPATIIFEAFGTSNYWRQRAIEAGHDARLISAKLVSTVRQNQKTDKTMPWRLFRLRCYPMSPSYQEKVSSNSNDNRYSV
jgi:transposase